MSRVRSTPKYSHIFKIQSEIRSRTKGNNMPLNWGYTKIVAPNGAMASNLWSITSRRPANPACRRKCRWKLSSTFPTIRTIFSSSSTIKADSKRRWSARQDRRGVSELWRYGRPRFQPFFASRLEHAFPHLAHGVNRLLTECTKKLRASQRICWWSRSSRQAYKTL